MSLETLIENALKANDALEFAVSQSATGGLTPEVHDPLWMAVAEADDKLLDFIYQHADALIAWERQHALHLSPFDE